MIGFTLTMWDVKKITLMPENAPEGSFYLNYVGCKAELVNGKHTDKLCFTLTMWDVKYFSAISFNSDSVVLP